MISPSSGPGPARQVTENPGQQQVGGPARLRMAQIEPAGVGPAATGLRSQTTAPRPNPATMAKRWWPTTAVAGNEVPTTYTPRVILNARPLRYSRDSV